MTLRAIILGCGSSAGVPRLGGPDGAGDWGNCDPNNPKNHRTRCSILVQKSHPDHGWETDQLTTILVDTSPDLRAQLLREHIARVDAVLITHDHADQTHGLDDLRVLAMRMKSRVPIFVDESTAGQLLSRFSYCFDDNPKTGYPAILDHRTMPGLGAWTEITGPSGPISFLPFLQGHGPVDSLGFRFGRQGGIAYSSDVKSIDGDAFDHINGVQAWIVDALRYDPHPSHSHVDQTLEWITKAKTERGVLTNLHIDLDYDCLNSETPDHIDPAFDGMTVEVSAD